MYKTGLEIVARALLITTLAVAGASIVVAQTTREQAQRIHDRLAGAPPSDAVLNQMMGQTPLNAALTAMNDRNFYAVTLKNFAAPWTNRDGSPFVALNDYTTLVIGLVKDDQPFDQILYGDVLYVGPGLSPPASPSDNLHFEALEARMMDPSFAPSEIVQTTQSSTYGLPAGATAGAMTTRAAAEAFFIAGTNRAMFRFTLINHMCTDLEQLHDTSIIPDRIRQDVSRSPGGDSRVYLNNCIGCHSGMDPMAQAFAYYNFNDVSGSIEYTPGSVQAKYFNNADSFADGFITPDDAWDNYWREGQNAIIGWGNSSGSGNGAKSLGQEFAASRAFAECQVRKVFKTVCLREPVDQPDRDRIVSITDSFIGNNYNLRQVFAESAVYCMGN